MEFRILGPLEVADGERPIQLEAAKPRALLGVLLLHPNEVVSGERLIDELWGERPPATAGKVVQTYVSQLRRALGPGRIATRPPGYVLSLDGNALDANEFRRLAAKGRRLASGGDPEGGAAAFREGLALWRGPPLADVLFESFARNEVEQLDEERLAVLMDRIECDLALGRHGELVAELETLVRQYPLRERLRRQLMLALYRSGRQADALAAYQDTRRTLDDELGLEPSRELQDLEKAILTHDPELQPPATAVRHRPERRRRLRLRAVSAATLVLLTLALGLAFVLPAGEESGSIAVQPNSVGFIDAESGRVTRSFRVTGEPRALSVANDAVWVANYRDRTVTRLDRTSGPVTTIAVGGHPTGLASYRGKVWVWTVEQLLVPIDPRFNSVGAPVPIGNVTAPIGGVASDSSRRREGGGRIASGGGFLWITLPLTTVIRVNPAEPEQAAVIVPDDGARAPILYGRGEAWVAGYDEVFPIGDSSDVPGSGIRVGVVRDLAFGAGSIWVVGGGQMDLGMVDALRRVDLRGRVVEATIPIGNPTAVASAGGSIWVASRSDRTIRRVDPGLDRAVDTISLGGAPTALASDVGGVWVAVR